MNNNIPMNKTITVPGNVKILCAGLLAIGIGATFLAFSQNPQRAWGNYLICSYYFLSLAVGASFFAAIQNITQAGWSAMFKRIPESIIGFLPYAAFFIIITGFFGAHSLYHWANEDMVRSDSILLHKSPFLNVPFFLVRTVLSLGLWIALASLLRKISLREDHEGGTDHFIKSEFYSKVFIFVLAFTFSLGTFDWIMSIDSHWFSTIYAAKNFISAFLHASAMIIILVSILYKKGYFPALNSSHLQDFSKYLFMLSMIWGYMWFCQFFLMWFANIPEEVSYYTVRLTSEWKTLFFSDLLVNWTFPFLFLFHNRICQNINALVLTSVIVLIGFWLDIYLQVMPGLTGMNSIGAGEIGIFLGFWGVFIFAVTRTLSKASIIPINHPYIKESTAHETH